MAEITFNTKHGEVNIRTAVFDTDGTNLQDGVEVKLDDELVKELYGRHVYQFEDMSVEEIEKFLEEEQIV